MDRRRLSIAKLRHCLPPFAATLVAAGGCLAGMPAPVLAQIVPVSDEIAISSPDGDYESGARVAADRNGGWGVTWSRRSLDEASEIGRLRRFDREGVAVPGTLRDHELAGADLGLDGEGQGVLAGVRLRPDVGGAEVDARCVDALGVPRGDRVRVDAGTISPFSRYPSNVRVATDSDGRSVVAWQEVPRVPLALPSVFFRRLLADCATQGEVVSLGGIGEVGRREPHVAYRRDGGFVLVWVEGAQVGQFQVKAQRFDADGAALAPAFPVSQGDSWWITEPRVAVARNGEFAVVWKVSAQPGTGSPTGASDGIVGRVFADDGTALGGELPLRLSRAQTASVPAVAAVGGTFVAVWGENGFVEEGSAVYGRAFAAAGPLGGEVVLNVEHTDPDNVRIAALGGNELVVVWDDLAEQTLPQDIVARRFVMVPPGTGCAEGSSALCLGAERFRIEVEWRDYQGRHGAGHAYPLTTDSGLFWFFGNTNMEVLVKVVNACAGFSRHWVYAAATTDVEYTLTATDTATGRSRSYFNPLGRRSAAITDSNAFATCP